MPEGDNIHEISRKFSSRIVGHTVRTTSPQGRFAEGAAALDGASMESAEAHGKHLFVEFDTEPRWLHIHLGLYGRSWFRHTDDPEEPAESTRLRMIGNGWTFDLRGPIKCALITEDEKDQVHNRLGADPLRNDGDIGWYGDWLCRTPRTIGDVLLDQSVFAGLGNVYRCELPFIHGIHPLTECKDVSWEEWKSIWKVWKLLMEQSVERGQRITTHPLDAPYRTYVYGKTGKGCLRCDDPIVDGFIVKRRIYVCNTCQPLDSRGRSFADTFEST